MALRFLLILSAFLALSIYLGCRLVQYDATRVYRVFGSRFVTGNFVQSLVDHRLDDKVILIVQEAYQWDPRHSVKSDYVLRQRLFN